MKLYSLKPRNCLACRLTKITATKLLLAAAILLSTFCFEPAATAAPGDLDLTFGGTGKAVANFGGGQARALATTVQSDGKLILAGYRTTYYSLGGAFLTARFTTNQVLDNTFGLGGIVTTYLTTNDCEARAVAVQSDGKIVVAGYAYRKTTNADFALVRYHPDGSPDSTFGTNGVVYTDFGQHAVITAMALQADGKIVVDGYFGFPGGGAAGIALARYQTNGLLDPNFGSGGKIAVPGSEYDALFGIAIQADQKILAVGDGGGADFAIYRFNTNGTTDTTFGGGTGRVLKDFGGSISSSAYCVAIQSGGITIGSVDKIVAAGILYDYGFSPAKIYQVVIRYNLDGTYDSTFGTGGLLTGLISSGIPYPESVRVLGSLKNPRKIVVGGSYSDGVSNYFAVCAYTASGQLDSTFGANNSGKISLPMNSYHDDAAAAAMTLQSGNFIVAGYTGASEAGYQFATARFTSTGLVDTSFGNQGVMIADVADGSSLAHAVAVQTDGKIVAVGHNTYFTNNNMNDRFAIARFNPDGTGDNSFGKNGKTTVVFGANGYDDANAVAIQPNGKIIAAGASSGGFALARLNSNGSLDPSFGTNGVVSIPIGSGGAQVNALHIQPDGKILAGGYGSSAGYYNFALARFNANGLPDTSFGSAGAVVTTFPGPYALAYGINMQRDGKIVLGGTALSVNGTTLSGDFATARYTTNGALDFSYGNLGRATGNAGGGTLDVGYAMAIQPDGKILIAGAASFGNFAGPLIGTITSVNSFLTIMRFNTNGTPDNTFGTGGSVITQVGNFSDFATALVLQPDGKVLVSGATQNGLYKFFALRYTADGDVDSTYGNGGAARVDFGSNSNEVVYAMALDSYGRAVLAGDAGGSFGLARLQGDALVGPTLKISLTATNTAVVSWPYPATGWYLTECADLSYGYWTTPEPLIFNDGINNFIVLTPASLNRFYRLQNFDPISTVD